MSGNPKFAILEKDGVEFGGPAEYVPEAEDVTFDNTSNVLTATETQSAIEETLTYVGQSRYAVNFGKLGNINAPQNPVYLQTFFGQSSNISPFPLPENSQLVALTLKVAQTTNATVTIYKNDIAITTIDLVAEELKTIKNLSFSLAEGDLLSAALTSGSTKDPSVYSHVKVD